MLSDHTSLKKEEEFYTRANETAILNVAVRQTALLLLIQGVLPFITLGKKVAFGRPKMKGVPCNLVAIL